MPFNQNDFNELTRKAADLTSATADVPRLIRLRLGPDHELAKAADEMLGRLETFVRELRSYHGLADADQSEAADT